MNAEEMGMMGIELLGQCVDATAEQLPDQPEYLFKLKILDIVYSAVIPKNEAESETGAKEAWKHLLEKFFMRHAAGNRALYNEGNRELTDEEKAIIEMPVNRKQRREKRSKSGLIIL